MTSKYLALTVLLILITTVEFGCGGATTDEPAPRPSALGRLTTAQSKLQLGVQDWGTVIERTLVFVNEGPGTLTIQDIATSCDCATWNEVPRGELAPGMVVEIPLRLDFRLEPGRLRRNLSVTHDGENSPVVITIEGEVLPPWRSLPAVPHFGALPPGETKSLEFRLRSLDIPRPRIVALKSSHPNLEALDHHAAADAETTLSARLTAPSFSGHWTADFIAEVQSGDPHGRITITCAAWIEGPLRCEPQSLAADRGVTIRSRTGERIELLSTRGGGAHLKLATQRLSADAYLVTPKGSESPAKPLRFEFTVAGKKETLVLDWR